MYLTFHFLTFFCSSFSILAILRKNLCYVHSYGSHSIQLPIKNQSVKQVLSYDDEVAATLMVKMLYSIKTTLSKLVLKIDDIDLQSTQQCLQGQLQSYLLAAFNEYAAAHRLTTPSFPQFITDAKLFGQLDTEALDVMYTTAMYYIHVSINYYILYHKSSYLSFHSAFLSIKIFFPKFYPKFSLSIIILCQKNLLQISCVKTRMWSQT